MLALLLFFAPTTALRIPGPLSPRIANYAIEASLDAPAKKITAHEHLTWRNATSTPASTLVFHLYMNAFRNEASTFFRESHGHHRRSAFDKHGWGAIDVAKISVNGQPAALEVNDTLGTVQLKQPIAAGAIANIEIEFTTRLPKVFARTGWADDFYAVAQWFPKIGVFDGAWRAHQHHLNSEFFADFGVYDVQVEVPENFIVGATGIEVGRETKNSRTKIRYHAEDVTDFAWFASPKFHVEEQAHGDINLRLLLWRGHQGVRHFAAAKAGLDELERRYGKYPYTQITLIDVPDDAEGAGGMEYPTLFTTMTLPVPDGIHLDEWITIHELSHQYTQGILATDEVEEAFLDEGFTETMTDWGLSRMFGRDRGLYEWLGHRLAYSDASRLGYRTHATIDAPATLSFQFLDNGSYSINSYSKIDLILRTAEILYGADKVEAGMRNYYDKAKFTHPRRQDFVRLFNEGAGVDATKYFHDTLETADVVDYELLSITAEQIHPPAGLITQNGVESEVSPSPNPAAPWRSEVIVHRAGEIVLPVALHVVFDDGSVRDEKWNGEQRWQRFTYETPKPVAHAELSPLPLDVNHINDGKRRERDGSPRRRIVAKWQRWLSIALAAVGF